MLDTIAHQHFDELFHKARRGNRADVQAFFDQCAPTVLAAVRRKMTPAVRTECESTDIVQEAELNTLELLENNYFQSPKDFLAFMIVTAHNEIRQIQRKQYRRTQAGAIGQKSVEEVSAAELAQLVDRGPPVHELLAFEEQLDHLFRSAPPMLRRIVQLIGQGYTREEIAADMGVGVRTVGRLVAKVKVILEEAGFHGPK